MEKLWKFNWYLGRGGDVEGVFIATQEEIDAAVGKRVYFGEICGKHSEVQGTLEAKDLKEITDDETVIAIVKEHLDGGMGYSPLDYITCEHGMNLAEECCETCDPEEAST
jgi:hypothetical protein